ncbi:hypothetical protein TIFTF001_039331 [Ficus carica]|uniref:Uncharacterized protein n=1 Tax=Ficus carica TaxID=3494 RepID=A0AA88EJH7_FICCA|nr:hypothetical protein TIFTF001_039331 [Ficus carica]
MSYRGEHITKGSSLLLYPDSEQHYMGHSGRGKYNSAYSIGFCCDTCLNGYVVLAERKLTSYVYAVGKQPAGTC